MTFNVLIVDDEKNIRAGLGRALEMDGYRTLLAGDGQEALDVIRDEEVDLVIADLKMPRLSGEELLRRIVDQYPTVPVIILTGHGTIETAVQAMRDGAYDFLTKPVSLDRLSPPCKASAVDARAGPAAPKTAARARLSERVIRDHRKEHRDAATHGGGPAGGADEGIRPHHR
jgi:DNA-binding NtrC family response regulator